MNGRIYDPQLGRFLQADPMVAEPNNPQNWNPYSYVFNNPLVNTDPTGMFSVSKFFQWVPLVLDVLAIIMPAWAPALLEVAQAVRVLGAIYGTIRGGIAGAFTAAANYEFGIAGAAIVAGAISESRGGGFWVAARREAVSELEGDVLNFVEGQIEGACASEESGGKFENGEDTAATSAANAQDLSKNPELNADPDPSTIGGVTKSPNFAKYVTVDPLTGVMSISVPYDVDPNVDPNHADYLVNQIQNGLSKTFAANGQPDITISVTLTKSTTNPLFEIVPCEDICKDPSNEGYRNDDVNPHTIEVRDGAAWGTAIHEFLHEAGFEHQLNSTSSIMSYSSNRFVTYSDAQSLYNAYH